MTERAFDERELTILLNEALQQAIFLVPRNFIGYQGLPYRCSAEQLRRAYYAAPTRLGRSIISHIRPQIADRPHDDLTTALRTHLGKYVVDDLIENGLAVVTGGPLNLSLAHYAESLVRAAALSGPERVAQLLTGWARGKPLSYYNCAVFSGLLIDKPMLMDEGIRFSTLPKSSDVLANELPIWEYSQTGIMEFANATKVAIECHLPGISEPGEFPYPFTTTCSLAGGFSEVDEFWDALSGALSLALNRHVVWIVGWEDYGDLTNLGTGASAYTYGSDTIDDMRTNRPGPPMSQEQLDYAGNLFVKCRNHRKPAPDIPLRRWMNSKRSSADLADRFIDLRIALEALYLGDGGTELGFRLATRGAWHLGTNFDERKAYHKILRDVYNAASNAVHTGRADPTEKNHQLLSDAQDLCRSGILKRLNEGAAPDWNTLILGNDPDTTSTNDETRP